jgi:hypothetical protein
VVAEHPAVETPMVTGVPVGKQSKSEREFSEGSATGGGQEPKHSGSGFDGRSCVKSAIQGYQSWESRDVSGHGCHRRLQQERVPVLT